MSQDIRRVTTKLLEELIRKDPLCEFYRKRDLLNPAGIHLVMMERPSVTVENVRKIVVDRVKVWADVTNKETTVAFLMEIPHAAFESLPQAVRD